MSYFFPSSFVSSLSFLFSFRIIHHVHLRSKYVLGYSLGSLLIHAQVFAQLQHLNVLISVKKEIKRLINIEIRKREQDKLKRKQEGKKKQEN